jgi:hypothetical protein
MLVGGVSFFFRRFFGSGEGLGDVVEVVGGAVYANE